MGKNVVQNSGWSCLAAVRSTTNRVALPGSNVFSHVLEAGSPRCQQGHVL